MANMKLSCLPCKNSPSKEYPASSIFDMVHSQYYTPLDINSDTIDGNMSQQIEFCKPEKPQQNGLVMKFQHVVAYAMEKISTTSDQSHPLMGNAGVSPGLLPFSNNNNNTTLQNLSIMQQNYNKTFCPVYHSSSNPYISDCSNEVALNTSNLPQEATLSQKIVSKLNPNSPPFLSKHTLNPEAAEYIPQHMRCEVSLPPEVELRNRINGVENLPDKELSREVEETMSFPSHNTIEGPSSPQCSTPNPDSLHCNGSCLDLPNVALEPVSLIIASKLQINSEDNDSPSSNSQENLSTSLDDSSENPSIRDSFCESELSGHSTCSRSLSESSVDSSDSFQIEFGDFDDNEVEEQQSGKASRVCFKVCGADLFATQSSDDEDDLSTDSETEDDNDSVDGDYSNDIFKLGFDDAWNPQCRLDIDQLLSPKVISTNSTKCSIQNPLPVIESGFDAEVCDYSDMCKDINERWQNEVEKECKEATPSKVAFCDIVKVCPLIVWKYAYQVARKGPWMEAARDRERFRMRIERAAEVLNPILDSAHRDKMFSSIQSHQKET